MHYITSSFLDKTLEPLQRIYRIWFATFSLRIWRFWLCKKSPYHLNINFISSNAYLCVELCAHSLVLIILLLESQKKPELFLPWLYSSQCCECYFRAARSCSTFGSSQVNFSLKDFLCDKCRKVDASSWATSEGLKHGIQFPRVRRPFDGPSEEKSDCCIPENLPLIDEIEESILNAKRDALLELAKIGN